MNPYSRHICVFCGSSMGTDKRFAQLAQELGFAMVERRIGLVFGGGSIGLMGQVAMSVNSGGAPVFGVIPKVLEEREVASWGIGETVVVDSMHTRKALMAEKADGFIALPGGFGTLDELFEILTWRQLGIHSKPIAILDPLGFYDPMMEFIDALVLKGFVGASARAYLNRFDSVEGCLDWFAHEWKGD